MANIPQANAPKATAATSISSVSRPDGTVAKARELSGQSNLLFIRNSVTGAVEARPRDGHGIVLNTALHAND